MKIGEYEDDKYLDGLRLIDRDGNYLFDQVWCSGESGEWVTKKIPPGHEIIGLHASIDGLFYFNNELLECKLN